MDEDELEEHGRHVWIERPVAGRFRAKRSAAKSLIDVGFVEVHGRVESVVRRDCSWWMRIMLILPSVERVGGESESCDSPGISLSGFLRGGPHPKRETAPIRHSGPTPHERNPE